jgi:pyruvate/2-oxoglutarate dehydrogenase complex dihydrolipoamide acyltransferase (E2) component
MATQVIMPQLGESVIEGTISKWLKQEGEAVHDLEPLLEVETDKVNSDIPSPAEGTLLKILVPEGTTVQAGTIIAWVGQPDEAVTTPTSSVPDRKLYAASHPDISVDQPASGEGFTPGRSSDLGFISPVVARLAKDNQVDLRQVKGTGESGRITKKDVLAYIERQKQPNGPVSQTPPEAPAWETPGDGDLFRPTELTFAGGGPGVKTQTPIRDQKTAIPASPPSKPNSAADDQHIPLTNIRRSIAEHMLNSSHTAPHVTTVMEANLQRVALHREANKARLAQDGLNLTYTVYFVAAAAAALRAFPLVNSSWNQDEILVHKPVHIGLAASLGEEGLIVPVIKHADELSLVGLARAINDLSARARTHHLLPDEVHGGTFTITNHGTGRSLFATPIIYQPQCAILGVGAIQKRVVVIEDAIAIRPMVYLSLTFDHRILDGSSADAFLAKVVDTLENWI